MTNRLEKLFILSIAFICILFLNPLHARQSSDELSDLKSACEVSGGKWVESVTGNWACCWEDWGCYGCVDNVCKINCHNQRCRKANSLNRVSTDQQRVKDLAPAGTKAPIAPKPRKTPTGMLRTNQRNN